MSGGVVGRQRGATGSWRRWGRSPALWGIGGAALLVLVWYVAARIVAAQSDAPIPKLASPLEVAGAIANYLQTDFVVDLISSLAVFFAGWLLGAAAATISGLLLARITWLGQMFLPVVEAIRPVSSIAWIPLSIVWFGFGFSGKVFIVGLAVYLVVIVYAIAGASKIPEILERSATMLGMTSMQKMRHLVLPSMLSEVIIGLRVSLMAGWGTVIIAELVAADTGMGSSLILAQQSYDVPGVMSSMLCFGAVGFLLNAAFGIIQRRVIRWDPEVEA